MFEFNWFKCLGVIKEVGIVLGGDDLREKG